MRISRFPRPALIVGLLLFGVSVLRAQQPLMLTWLLLNQSSQETLLVMDAAEKDKLQHAGWLTNGHGSLALHPAADLAGVHRLVASTSLGYDRVFSLAPEEIEACLKAGYHDEGVLGQGAATQLKPEMIPVYRFSRASKHLWLIGTSARPWAEKNGWKFGGIAFWIWPATP